MTLTRRRFLTICAAASVSGTAEADTVWEGNALGAPARIVLRADASMAKPALAAARDTLSRVEAAFSLFADGSELRKLNATGGLSMSPTFAALVVQADQLHHLTGGLFDPSVGARWRELAGGVPGPVGWRLVNAGRSEIALPNGMELTFNGIAQGFATDAVAAALAAHGLRDVVVDAGEVWAGDRPASIGIEARGQILRRLILRNSAIATSTPGALSVGGNSHILHPHGGRPRWASVSVEASGATVADAVSTALTLAPDTGLARRLKADGVIRRAWFVDAEERMIAV